jgi:hypothetical protein
MTGRLPIRTGIYTNYSYPLDDLFRVFMPNSAGCLPENETTVATYLGNAGYYTALVGKWHIGHNPKRNCMPTRKGFSYFYGLPYRCVSLRLSSCATCDCTCAHVQPRRRLSRPRIPGKHGVPAGATHAERRHNPATTCGFGGPHAKVLHLVSVDAGRTPVRCDCVFSRYTEQVLALLDIASGNKPNPTPVDPITPAPAAGQPFFLYVTNRLCGCPVVGNANGVRA